MAILTKLKTGKALGAQRGFVETFNAIVDFVRNLKGDADVNNATGLIELDRGDATHPVIRVKPGGKTGGGGAAQITVVGNDGATPSEAVCTTGRIAFVAASDTNIIFTPSADSAGNVTVTVGVRYVGPAQGS